MPANSVVRVKTMVKFESHMNQTIAFHSIIEKEKLLRQ